LQRKALLELFALTPYDTDHGGADTRHQEPDVPSPGQRNTHHIERQHVTLRTRMQRLVRTTLCFSTSVRKHDLVLGWFVHRSACGWAGSTWLSPLLEHDTFRYIKETQDIKLDPLAWSVQEKQTVNVPIWAGVGAIVAGGGLLLRARKNT
jgi:LPXTG-motif cell wall-anchored protein